MGRTMVAVAVLMLTVACGGDSGGTQVSEPTPVPALTVSPVPTATPEPSSPSAAVSPIPTEVPDAAVAKEDELADALASLPEGDLAIMVLPLEAYGDAGEGLEVDPNSGFQTSDEVADDSIDPDDTGADLERAGYVAGYSLLFEDASLSALNEGAGILVLSSEVQMFDDDQAASAYLAKLLEDLQRLEGEEVEPGLTLEEAEEFAVAGISADATGRTLHAEAGGLDLYFTTVMFTTGRLSAAVSLIGADNDDVRSDVETITREFAERIEEVLLGELDEAPVPIPEDDGGVAAAPSEPPFPDEMALSLEDLSEGALIELEGYEQDADAVSRYRRKFDVDSVDVGATRASFLTSTVLLYADEREARNRLQVQVNTYEAESGRAFFEEAIAGNTEIEISVTAYQIVQVPGLGDPQLVIEYSYDSPFGEIDGVILSFQVGRAIGRLTVEGLTGDIELADVVNMANAQAARMSAALEANP